MSLFQSGQGQTVDAANSTALLGATGTRSFTVGTTLGSKTVTSSAQFTAGDVGSCITGTGIPGHAIIVAVASASSATFQCAPDYAAGVPDPTATATGSVTGTVDDGWAGDWTMTRTAGIVRQLVVLASTELSGLGGTFAFQYGEDGSTAIITEVREIADFETVRDFSLVNAGAYFRVMFCPDRPLTSGEGVFITTTLSKQDDGPFVRLANQQIEEANAAMGQTFAYLKAFDPRSGKSTNIRPDPTGALYVNSSGQVATYSAAAAVTAEATPTDVFTIYGAAGKVIRIRELLIAGTNTLNANVACDAVRRSTANSGGTSSTVTAVPANTADDAASATVRAYTVDPTLGTTVGVVRNGFLFLPSISSSNAISGLAFEFGTVNSQAFVLRGTGEGLAVNPRGASISGTTTLDIWVEWTEEDA